MQPADLAATNRNRQPTAEMHAAITTLHAAIAAEPDAEDKAALSQALATLMRVQGKNAAQDKKDHADTQRLAGRAGA